MVRCVSLPLCLLAGVCLLAGSAPLLPSLVQEGSQTPGKQPGMAHGVTGSEFERKDSLSDPTPAPVASNSPPAVPNGLSQSIYAANGTGQLGADSAPHQTQAGEAGPQSSGRRAESTTVSPTELQRGGEVTALGKGSKKEVPLAQPEGNYSQTGLILNRMGADTLSPTAGGNQNPKSGRGPEEGLGQGSLLSGGALELPAGNMKEPAITGSQSTAQDAHLSQTEREGSEDTTALSISVHAQTSTGTNVEPPATIQAAIKTSHDLPPPALVPWGPEPSRQRGTEMSPPTSVATQVKGSDSPGVQGQTGEKGAPAEQLLSSRREPGVQGEEGDTKIANPLPTNPPALPEDSIHATLTVINRATTNSTYRAPYSSSTPSSEGAKLRQTAVMDRVQESTSVLSNTKEILLPKPHLTPSPSDGQNTTGGAPGHSVSSEETTGPTPNETPQGGSPGTKQGVAAHSSTRGALQQGAVVGKGNTPSSTGPDPEPTLIETAGAQHRARGDRPACEGTAFGQDVEATPTPEDLPLIFEPVDDVLSEVTITASPGGAQQVSQFSQSSRGVLSGSEFVVAVTASGAPPPSGAPHPALHDGSLLSGQMSGKEMTDTSSSSLLPSLTSPPPGSSLDYGILHSEERDVTDTPTWTTEAPPISYETQRPKSTVQLPPTNVTTTTSLSLPRPKSGLEELESEEEHDDDEVEEDTEESEEEESQEDVTEVTTTAHVPPAYSHIPYHFHSGPIWVQRNQGLVHSWVEKIRDKAGYVSGMLAPVGIGIAGALFILGALYSIKVMHRKRRSSYKRQRRKHRETSSRQDRVMLLADSSEDEL